MYQDLVAYQQEHGQRQIPGNKHFPASGIGLSGSELPGERESSVPIKSANCPS